MQFILHFYDVALWAVMDFCVSVIASAHVLLNKRNSRAAVGWVGVIWLTPFLGSVLYLLLGINRIERHARRKRPSYLAEIESCPVPVADESAVLSNGLRDLNRLALKISGNALTDGNSVGILIDGDEAFPAMLGAIDAAKQSVCMSTYIFNRDATGQRFVEALQRANLRGIEIRVLVDMVGASYRWPTIARALRRAGVRTAYFLPVLLPWRLHYSNLRNHRKLLIVDGSTAFTGGMNIQQGHEVKTRPRSPINDIHFQISGPVVAQLQETFAIDWRFTTDELLQGPGWFVCPVSTGNVAARCIADGPDEDIDRTRKLLHGAIMVARESIVIVTPYFLPDAALITALNIAALRGVAVDIHLPENGNLRFVQWACMSQIWQVLEHGCRVWLTPDPFDHSKLMVVDNQWALVGSSNWDPRSLRLNFELNVELYSSECASKLGIYAEQRRKAARQLTLDDVHGRPVWKKLRDGVASLLSPYL